MVEVVDPGVDRKNEEGILTTEYPDSEDGVKKPLGIDIVDDLDVGVKNPSGILMVEVEVSEPEKEI